MGKNKHVPVDRISPARNDIGKASKHTLSNILSGIFDLRMKRHLLPVIASFSLDAAKSSLSCKVDRKRT